MPLRMFSQSHRLYGTGLQRSICQGYPNLNRTVDSPRGNLRNYTKKMIPTGDPLCPPAVCWGKRLRIEIINRLDVSDLNSEEGAKNLEEGDETTLNLGGNRPRGKTTK
jgi:hypothetical protein